MAYVTTESRTEIDLAGDAKRSSYGKACLCCVRSKTRCAPARDGGKCERCLRLNKECQPAPTSRKTRVSKKSSSKTARLEEKLDGIVKLLQVTKSNDDGRPSASGPRASHMSPESTSPASGAVYQPLDPWSTGAMATGAAPSNNLPTPAPSAIEIFPPKYPPVIPDDYPLETELECEEYLETYRSQMVPYFPVVPIEPHITVADMREQRPFLWTVIRALCSKNFVRQRALCQEVRKTACKQIFLDGIKSLDLLLGLLVFTGWGHYWLCGKGIISSDILLATSIANDLGLTKPVPEESMGVMLNFTAQGCPKPPQSLFIRPRTMEERRAVIGLFLITSLAANYFQRMDQPQWTAYLEESLTILNEKEDRPTDVNLVYLVRVQLLCNQAAQVGSTTQPREIYVKTLSDQLEQLQYALPLSLKSNLSLKLQILNTTISIHEHSLSKPKPTPSTADPVAKIKRIESLQTCLTAVTEARDTFFSLENLPFTSYVHIPLFYCSALSHTLVCLFRLTTFESSEIDWDRQRVLRECNFSNFVKMMADHWASVPAAAGLDTDIMSETDTGPWAYTRRALLIIHSWFEAKILPGINGQPNDAGRDIVNGLHQRQQEGLSGNSSDSRSDLEATIHSEMVGFGGAVVDHFLDESWMKDMMGGGYDFFKDTAFY